jgi:branched-chain amino acid transport system permease protein
MLGGYLAFTFLVALSQSFIVSLAAILVVMAILGGVFNRLVVARCAKPDVSIGAIIIATLGVSYFLRGLVPLIWGTPPLRVPSPLGTSVISLLGHKVTSQYLLVIGVGVVCALALALIFQKTLTGLTLRATAMDRETASLMGINTGRTTLMATMASVPLAAIAGFIVTPLLFANIYLGLNILFKAWVAALIGGIGNHLWVFIGALLVGLLEIFIATYIYPGYADIVVFLVLLMTFIVRPTGLFASRSG